MHLHVNCYFIGISLDLIFFNKVKSMNQSNRDMYVNLFTAQTVFMLIKISRAFCKKER